MSFFDFPENHLSLRIVYLEMTESTGLQRRNKKIKKMRDYDKFIESLNVDAGGIKQLDNELLIKSHAQSDVFKRNLQEALSETWNENS